MWEAEEFFIFVYTIHQNLTRYIHQFRTCFAPFLAMSLKDSLRCLIKTDYKHSSFWTNSLLYFKVCYPQASFLRKIYLFRLVLHSYCKENYLLLLPVSSHYLWSLLAYHCSENFYKKERNEFLFLLRENLLKHTRILALHRCFVVDIWGSGQNLWLASLFLSPLFLSSYRIHLQI